MKRFWRLLMATMLFIGAMNTYADTRGFFRIQASGDTRITDYNSDGTIIWSNAVVGNTGKIQRVSSLPAPEDSWTDAHSFTANLAVMTVNLSLEEIPVGMVLVAGGSLPDICNGELNVATFLIGKYEVTKAEWDAVYAWAVTNGYSFESAGSGCASNHPVHTVSWYDVVKWCNARSEKEGRTTAYVVAGAPYRVGQTNDVVVIATATGYRLPTDAEWEFAARGGIHSQSYDYSGGNDVNAVAWYYENSVGAACNYNSSRGTWPVGQKAANELGIHDMSGNVWEWCFDWHPGGEGSLRVLCGGSWYDFADFYCQVGYRGGDYPDNTYNSVGFRVVLPPSQPLVTRVIRLDGDLAFGEVAAGQIVTRTLTIYSDGNAPLTVTGIAYPSGFSGAFSGSIAAGESREVAVTFGPTNTQSYGGTLTVNSDATGGTATTSLSGTGVTASRVIRPDGDLAYGFVPVGESATRTLTIYNDGNAPLTVTGIFYPTGFRGAFSGAIAAGSSQTVDVTFSPMATQSYGGTLTLNSDATGGTISHPLGGTSIPPPNADYSPCRQSGLWRGSGRAEWRLDDRTQILHENPAGHPWLNLRHALP